MAVAFNHLTTDSSTANVSPYVTASLTPTAGRVYLVGLMVGATTSPNPTPTITGWGLTWTQVVQNVAGFRASYIFRATGTPTAGALTITTTGANLPNGCFWSVVEAAGADMTGTNGSGAIVQSHEARPLAATSVSSAFPTAPTAGNGGFAVVGIGGAQETVTPGAGWTGASTSQTTPNNSMAGMWAASCPSAISASWTSSVTSFLAGVEIKAAGGAVNLNRVRLGTTVAKLYLGTTLVPKAYLGTTQVYP